MTLSIMFKLFINKSVIYKSYASLCFIIKSTYGS